MKAILYAFPDPDEFTALFIAVERWRSLPFAFNWEYDPMPVLSLHPPKMGNALQLAFKWSVPKSTRKFVSQTQEIVAHEGERAYLIEKLTCSVVELSVIRFSSRHEAASDERLAHILTGL